MTTKTQKEGPVSYTKKEVIEMTMRPALMFGVEVGKEFRVRDKQGSHDACYLLRDYTIGVLPLGRLDFMEEKGQVYDIIFTTYYHESTEEKNLEDLVVCGKVAEGLLSAKDVIIELLNLLNPKIL